VLHIHI